MLEKVVPGVIKRAVRGFLQSRQRRRSLRRIASLRPPSLPDARTLRELRAGWGNEGFSAKNAYLAEIARLAAATAGPILECGSGASTLLLGALTLHRGVQIWTLENDPEWHALLSRELARQGLTNVHLCLVPLRAFGDFSWYGVAAADLPPEFSLVVCDGPPGTTPGGRYGLLPLLRDRLPVGATILLDDAARPEEQQVLARWAAEADLRIEVVQPSDEPLTTFARVHRVA
jgi:predicted O-methyltransferase YrrM